ncbi:response regulator [Nibricoccus sp. IMCC34717]|uniref:response regulator n=1 Tax=Nibricoccus sp. IMCC34717 TaxID=3034021 RepID=UPI00384D3869
MSLRVLALEDSEVDFQRLQQELARTHPPATTRRVATRADFLLQIAEFKPDVITSAYHLKHLSGLEALELAKQFASGVPFVFVTASVGEDLAVECLRRGAADYVGKSRIATLPALLRAALERRRSERPAPQGGAVEKEINARRQAEAAVKEAEMRFRRMADSAPVLIWMTDVQRSFTYFNKPWLEFTGRTLTQETGNGWQTSIHPDDREHTLSRFDEGFAARTSFRVEFRLLRHDHRYRWVVAHGTPRTDDQGRFAGFIGSCFDVTEQHEVEAHLAYRAIKQSALASFGRFALAQHTFPELCQEATRLVADTLRVERCQILCLTSAEHDLAISASTGPALDEPAIPLGRAAPQTIEDDLPLQLADSPDLFPASRAIASLGIKSGLAVPIGTGKHAYGFLIALANEERIFNREALDFVQGIAHILSTVHQRERAESALVESEQKLMQSQKMEAVGLLAGGVAHDFNNLLTAIRCYGDILHDELAEISPELKAKASEILKATARATALVRQLLAFTRKQVLQPEVLDLNLVVGELRELIRSLLTENIELEVDLGDEPIMLEIDRSQIEQVVMNLAINARDAMANTGGSLSLRTGVRDVLEGEDSDLKAGRYAELVVSDTGAGMSEEIQAKIFQPFFTTKPKGRGTGLGLATCTVVIKNYNGAIRFKSVVGEGTTFYVLLPLGELPAQNLDFDFDSQPDAGHETLLVVEDDEAIRSVTTTILRSLGYQVFPFSNGNELVDYVASGQAPACDLLVSDIVMPNMGGRELAEKLLVLRPGLKVLFMSGYVDDPVILQAVQEAAVPFLEKPFTRETLAKKVREALDAVRA